MTLLTRDNLRLAILGEAKKEGMTRYQVADEFNCDIRELGMSARADRLYHRIGWNKLLNWCATLGYEIHFTIVRGPKAAALAQPTNLKPHRHRPTARHRFQHYPTTMKEYK